MACSAVCVEGLRKTNDITIQDSQFPIRHFNLAPPPPNASCLYNPRARFFFIHLNHSGTYIYIYTFIYLNHSGTYIYTFIYLNHSGTYIYTFIYLNHSGTYIYLYLFKSEWYLYIPLSI
jgi:hypothetical protein